MSLEADVVKAIDACRSDLTRVVDELKWALTTGLDTTGALDEPEIGGADEPATGAGTGALGALSTVDVVPGARWALDIGDHRLRQAFIAGVGHLAAAELRTAKALYVMGHRSQPRLTLPSERSTVMAFDACETTMRWRFDRIARDAGIVPPSQLKLANRHLQGNYRRDEPSARQALDLAFRELTSAFARGKTTIATAEPMCIICGIRPRADRRGRRCETCATWKQRNKSERPTSIDEKVIGSAVEAQARRAERGEGFGLS